MPMFLGCGYDERSFSFIFRFKVVCPVVVELKMCCSDFCGV